MQRQFARPFTWTMRRQFRPTFANARRQWHRIRTDRRRRLGEVTPTSTADAVADPASSKSSSKVGPDPSKS
jgi:hypothetical protein